MDPQSTSASAKVILSVKAAALVAVTSTVIIWMWSILSNSMNYKQLQVPSVQSTFSAAASVAAGSFLIQSIARDYVPSEIRDFFLVKLRNFFSSLSPQITITIDEGGTYEQNRLFADADLYLGTKISPFTHSFQIFIPPKENNIIFSVSNNMEVVDDFNGVHFKWQKKQVERSDALRRNNRTEIRYFLLSFHKKHRDIVFSSYLPHVQSESLKFKEHNKSLKIHTLRDGYHWSGSGHPWASVNMYHPATFETLAMELELKNKLFKDMDMFVNNEDFYRRVGKPWKRGYLLYGPPGTGKSSLIAAMADHLKFDIYDLELTKLRSNSELRKLLFSVPDKSILVVEDIDCTIDDLDRTKKKATTPDDHEQLPPSSNQEANNKKWMQVTLSGLLNFIDGLWSSCGDQRIIIFTTNHKERLDPALVRPGRMDFHIHMDYCTPNLVKMLVSNYTGNGITDQHPLLTQVEQLIPAAQVTPAEVCEQLMMTHHEDHETVLRGLVEFIKMKKEHNQLKASSTSGENSENSEIVKEGHPNSNDAVICRSCDAGHPI